MKYFIATITILTFTVIALFGFAIMVHDGDHNGCLIKNSLNDPGCLAGDNSLYIINAHFSAFLNFISAVFSNGFAGLAVLLFLAGACLAWMAWRSGIFSNFEFEAKGKYLFDQPVFCNGRVLKWVLVRRDDF